MTTPKDQQSQTGTSLFQAAAKHTSPQIWYSLPLSEDQKTFLLNMLQSHVITYRRMRNEANSKGKPLPADIVEFGIKVEALNSYVHYNIRKHKGDE